jgi:hypothetical protein
MGLVDKETPRPVYTQEGYPLPVVQAAQWASGPVWTCTENLAPAGVGTSDRPARSASIYQLRCPGRLLTHKHECYCVRLKDTRFIIRSGVRSQTGQYGICSVKVALRQGLLRVLRFSLVGTVPPRYQSFLFACPLCYLTYLIGRVVEYRVCLFRHNRANDVRSKPKLRCVMFIERKNGLKKL